MIELVLAIIISLGVGTMVGKQAGEEAAALKEPSERTPDVWIPTDHKDLLRSCALSCGEGNLLSYSVVYGSCKCKGE